MTNERRMGELQALITGAIQGALMKASVESDGFLNIEVEPQTDEQGWLPEIIVRGRVTGDVLRIKIEEDSA